MLSTIPQPLIQQPPKQIITLVKSFVWCWFCGDRQDFEMREDHKWHCKKCGKEWK